MLLRWLGAVVLAGSLLAAPAALAAGGPSGPPSELAAPPSAEPVPGPGPDGPVAVPEPDAKALAYYRSGNVLWWVGQAFGVAFPLVLLATGFSARMRSRAERIGRHWIPAVALYAVFYRVLD